MKSPTPCEIGNYGHEIGLPFEQCEAFFDHFEANGWRVAGKSAMKSWQAAMRTWKRNWDAGKFGSGQNGVLSGIDKMILQKELERCLDKIKNLNGGFNSMGDMTMDDRKKIKFLRDRATVIRKKLGILL